MVAQCPTSLRVPCIPTTSGEAGLTAQELANILSPLIGASGTVKQIISVQDGSLQLATTLLPQDDTIPQITEGDEVVSVAITPQATTNRIAVIAIGIYGTASGIGVGGALFRSDTTDAIAATRVRPQQTVAYTGDLACSGDVVAGTILPITFSLRMGPGSTPNTVFINGSQTAGGTRVFGGVATTFIRVTEYTP